MKKFIALSGLLMLVVIIGSIAAVSGAGSVSAKILKVSASDKTVVFYIVPVVPKEFSGKQLDETAPITGSFWSGTYGANGEPLIETETVLTPYKVQEADSQFKLFFDLAELGSPGVDKDWVATFASAKLEGDIEVFVSELGPGFAWRRR